MVKDNTSWAVCLALVMQSSPEKRGALLQFLPAARQKELQEMKGPFQNPLESQLSLETQLNLIHASWIAPYLRTYTESEIRLFLSALGQNQAKELQKTLLFTNQLIQLASSAKEYLQKILWKNLGGDEQIPLSCLQESSINSLLFLEDRIFNQLIFLLGLHDLAIEMRQIIETAKLKKIQAALSSEESHFLKELMLKKEPVTFKKISLSQWNGDEKSLKKLLQGRGLNRLAKALYGQNETFCWYIAHKLDMESAKQFFKLLVPLEIARVHEVLLSQVEEVLHYVQKYNT